MVENDIFYDQMSWQIEEFQFSHMINKEFCRATNIQILHHSVLYC